jgi:hypothetical protein
MTIDSMSLLRRIDTDFVNLSPVLRYLGIASQPTTIPNAVVITNSSPRVTGTWVPLVTAQSFVKDRLLPPGLVDIFLSDSLFERFPPALHDFHRSNAQGRILNKFGPHFKSTLEGRHPSQLSMDSTSRSERRPWDREPVPLWDTEDHLSLIQHAVGLTHDMCLPSADVADTIETPLSATEQEIFRTLCSSPDWDKENTSPAPSQEAWPAENVERTTENSGRRSIERPLRRSKRVADAARARARSLRRSTRNALT